MSDGREFCSKGFTSRDFLCSAKAAGTSIPILKSNTMARQPATLNSFYKIASISLSRFFFPKGVLRPGFISP